MQWDDYLEDVDHLLTSGEIEAWKPISTKWGCGDKYFVSNFGRVRHENKIVHQSTRGEYPGVKLSRLIEGRLFSTVITTAHLVAESFVSNPNGYDKVIHLDWNPQNNKAVNLEYISDHDYFARISRKLTRPQRLQIINALSDAKVMQIRKLLCTTSVDELTEKFNYSRSFINKIKMGTLYEDEFEPIDPIFSSIEDVSFEYEEFGLSRSVIPTFAFA